MIIQEKISISSTISMTCFPGGFTWFSYDNPPLVPKYGDAYFDTKLGISYVYDGSSWVQLI